MATALLSPASAGQINYLILALTTRCNLRCRYCYHGDPETRLDMAPSILQRAVMRAATGSGPLHIQLTGGEPCLVPELIETACRLAQQLQRPLTMGIQVNGTLGVQLTARTIPGLPPRLDQLGLEEQIMLNIAPKQKALFAHTDNLFTSKVKRNFWS